MNNGSLGSRQEDGRGLGARDQDAWLGRVGEESGLRLGGRASSTVPGRGRRRREEGLFGSHLCLGQSSLGSPHILPLTHPLGAASWKDPPGLGVTLTRSERLLGFKE